MNDDNKNLLFRAGRAADLRGLDRLFEAVLGEWPAFGARRSPDQAFGWAPAVDIRETDNDLIVYAALPGLSKDDVTLEVKDDTLALSGRLKTLGSDEDTWVRRELPRGDFYRAFQLPAGVDVAKVKAAMREGVLEIRLPKAEKARPQKIAIA